MVSTHVNLTAPDSYLAAQRVLYETVRTHVKTSRALEKFSALEDLLVRLDGQRTEGKSIAVSSGTFLLPHYAHVDYFEQARAQGDVHVVCMNSDTSVRGLGRCTEFVPSYGRVVFVAGLTSVDHVVLFDDLTPETMLSYIKPNVFTKGEDWKNRELPERDVVERHGGRVVFIPFTYTFSSTQLVENVRRHAR